GRSTATSRAALRENIARVEKRMGVVLSELPIRPSVIDNVVVELRRIDEQFTSLDKGSSGSDAESRRGLEAQVGLPRRTFAERFARVLDKDARLIEAKQQLGEPNLRLVGSV